MRVQRAPLAVLLGAGCWDESPDLIFPVEENMNKKPTNLYYLQQQFIMLKTTFLRRLSSSAAPNFLSAQKYLARDGAKAMKPTPNSSGKGFRKPKISGRKIAVMRKHAQQQKTYAETIDAQAHTETETVIHFKPSWDKKGPVFLPSRPDAAAAHQRRKLRRVAEIDAQLAKQDDLMKKHRKNLLDAKPKTFFDKLQASRPVV